MDTFKADFDVTVENGSCTVDSFRNGLSYEKVAAAFKRNGFNVTEEAICHNFRAWEADLKSGYLDKENGYFLWTPCGCNPLSFYAEKLNNKEYQKTYTC